MRSEHVDDDRPYDTPPPRRNRGGLGGVLLAVVALVAIAALAIAVFGFFDDEESSGPELGATVSDIQNDPSAFLGRTVTVSGAIEDFLLTAPAADGTAGFVLEAGLLVIAPNAEDMIGRSLSENDVVRVRGTVRTFAVAEVENDLGIDLDDELLVDFEEDVAIVATDMRLLDAAVEATPVDVTASDIVDDPEAFVGDTVTVESVVTEVLGPNAFAIEEGELLVVGEAIPAIGVSYIARVAGVVREFDADAIGEETGFDFDVGILDDWDGRPMIVATRVFTATS